MCELNVPITDHHQLTLESNGISVSVSVPGEYAIDDYAHVLRGMLVCIGFAMRTVDGIFDEEYRELEYEEEIT